MNYEAVIGLEVHVQALTASKMFCACANRFGAEPNTLVCPVCLGYPGALPVMNAEAVKKTIEIGLMCGCAIALRSKFDRKSYFYPDMPKNYQISQYDLPLCGLGHLAVGGKGFSGDPLPDKVIGITRIHLEEDVGKLNHFGRSSGVDYNRAGVPLMEVVSEPDMRSADEAYAYLTVLKQICEYAGVSSCDMEKGQMRCDVNVSVRPVGETKLGTKIEIKNLNSFRSVHRSLLYEIERQTEAVRAGEKLRQETRRWDDALGQTFVMRVKEQAHDYRYFPEPDLMPVVLDEAQVAAWRAALPEAPEARRARFVADCQVTPYDAHVLTLEKPLADYFEAAAKAAGHPKLTANWIITELLRELGEKNLTIDTCPIPPAAFGKLIALVAGGAITGKSAKDVFAEMFASGKAPEVIVQEKGLQQVNDSGAILAFVDQAIAASPKAVEEYRAGKTATIQFLVGQVMKLSRGKSNPQTVLALLKEKLG
jgi:aspartyl-tRNA(Asn)/glutamyl-tRNA(Gln) amidotransferase subunit B